MATVLITGAAGFIGSHLAAACIARGDSTHALVRPDEPAVVARVPRGAQVHAIALGERAAVAECFAEVQPELVFHLGVRTRRSPAADLSDVRGSIEEDLLHLATLLSVAASSPLPPRSFVRTGTLAEYGDIPAPYREEQREYPINAYATAMVAGTHYLDMLRPRLPYAALTARLALVYGPGQAKDFFVPTLITHCIRRQPMTVNRPEDRRDLLFVDDAAEALLRLAEAPPPVGIINVGTGIAPSTREIAGHVLARTGADAGLIRFGEGGPKGDGPPELPRGNRADANADGLGRPHDFPGRPGPHDCLAPGGRERNGGGEPMTAPVRKVSILVPAYNEEQNVQNAYRAIVDVFRSLPDYDYEIIFTDNHSTDRTYDLLKAIVAGDPKVRVFRFARNYGYQRSVLVAYQRATGDCAIQIDCDLQDPPSLIPHMLELWRQGNQVVYGVRRSLKDNLPTRILRRSFYRFINAVSDDELPLDAGEFRLVDGRILAELRKVDDTSPYVRGLISAMGFTQVGFEYDRQARTAGESKFPLRAMVALAIDGVLNHSLLPLRIASTISLIFGTLTFLLVLAYLVGSLLFGQDWPAGFATTTMLLLMSITLNAMFLGIIGEYLGRIFMQSKRRPVPIIEVSLDAIALPPPGSSMSPKGCTAWAELMRQLLGQPGGEAGRSFSTPRFAVRSGGRGHDDDGLRPFRCRWPGVGRAACAGQHRVLLLRHGDELCAQPLLDLRDEQPGKARKARFPLHRLQRGRPDTVLRARRRSRLCPAGARGEGGECPDRFRLELCRGAALGVHRAAGRSAQWRVASSTTVRMTRPASRVTSALRAGSTRKAMLVSPSSRATGSREGARSRAS